jgi:hypothetical protein
LWWFWMFPTISIGDINPFRLKIFNPHLHHHSDKMSPRPRHRFLILSLEHRGSSLKIDLHDPII